MATHLTNRRRSIRAGFLVLLVPAMALACTDRFDDLNSPSDQIGADRIDASLIGQMFAYAQFHGMRGQPGGGGFQIGQNLFSDLYAQYFATTTENFESDQYVNVGLWVNAAWNYFYSNAPPQLHFVENFTAENDLALENALTKVWRVEIFHRMTDNWGPIIYSEFGSGETSVAYDDQESIYRDFFVTLDEAVSVLEQNAGGTAFGAGVDDQIYAGNADQWRTFANSLRLRLAMRVRYADEALARQEAEKAVAAGVMTANADNAEVLTTADSRNPLETITAWGEFRMSAAMESVLEGYDDPRLGEYFDEAADGSGFQGLRNGQTRINRNSATLNPAFSDVDLKWRPLGLGGDNPPMRVMAAAEVYFLRAEGALLGWNMGGSAQELYEEGIRTSLNERTDATAAEIEAYISNTNLPAALDDAWDSPPMSDIPVAFEVGASTERQLEQIITQKWLGLYPDGIEAWAERRRTGYPRGYPVLESLNPDVPADAIMRRLRFADGERSTNSVATEAAEALLDGPDDLNSVRVWWDAKP
ncbi:MAG: SusD/RagB family nutrient-binding outer membrane lipoprotein [Longimicrobiales bacterium]